ncbi:MAG: D-aminoacylase [Nitrospira sp.]|nr:D-aminoacylase [Nitrospira sp.]
MKVDLIIKNGLVFDGTGSEPFEADIGISGDKVVFINRKSKGWLKPEKVIDAHGLAVAPGFIDAHSHSEFTLLADPRAEGKVCQGITTEINGNCGLSAAPLYGEALDRREEDLKELGISERWSTFEEYFEILGKKDLPINFATLVGHGNIRASVIGYDNRKVTRSDIKKMSTFLRKSIREGAIGLSTGLIYPPGMYSETAELIELCKTLIGNPPYPPLVKGGKGGFGIYTSHMRSEGDELTESIEETIKIGKESGIKVHISHIKTSGEENWHKIDKVISLLQESNREGDCLTCDRYPYTASSTDLDTVLPSWTFSGSAEKELKRLKSSRLQRKIKKEVKDAHPHNDYWDKVFISSVNSEKNMWMEGKSLSEIARMKGKEPVDILCDILIEERLKVNAIFSFMHEENLKKFLSLTFCMIGSDSSARSFSGSTCKGKPHPRGFGSFPRFLGTYVRDGILMSMSEAIHKITMLPAKTFGINNRGILKEGLFADVVIFDYEKIIDRATFHDPFLRPEGIYYVIVNGSPVIWEGEMTGIKAGRVLKYGR